MALRQGDCVRAQALALRLQQETIAAINSRRVPARLLEDLQSGVNVLADTVRCPAVAPSIPRPATTRSSEDEAEDEEADD